MVGAEDVLHNIVAKTHLTGKVMSENDALVLFMPSGKRGRFEKGTPVLEAARSLGVYVESVCGGRGICGKCQVSVAEGQFAKHGITSKASHLSAVSETELSYAKRRKLADNRRLSCSALVDGDLVIDVPQDAQINAQVVRKRAEGKKIKHNPAIRLYYVEVEEPDMDKPLGDLDRLNVALEEAWDLHNLLYDPTLLPKIQAILRKGQWKATVAVHESETSPATVVAVYPGFEDKVYGLAVDIGSTTIAAHLVDLVTGRTVASAGTSNPQIRFGEDLMSRVSYVMMNPDGREALTETVQNAVKTLAGKVCSQIGRETDAILDAVFVGNPVMHHLFLGIDPTELGGAPFALAVSGSLTLPARDLNLGFNPGARVYILPCIAGHVGADAAAATLTEAPHKSQELTLLVDVGTNAEIVLGNKDRLLAASSPTGPAFEGAEISCGQRAAPGAIERVRIDPVTLEPKIRVIGIDAWSDEEEFAEKIDSVGVTGVCGSGIIEVIAELFLSGIVTEDGIIDGNKAAVSDRIIQNGRTWSYRLWTGSVDLMITQNDIRAIQLAKAALYAGVRLLMDRLDLSGVERIKLAGAFGSYIEPTYAMVLGLIPDCDVEKVAAVGNAAGTGARMALLNKDHRTEIEELVRRIEKVETATESKFQEHFVNAMAFPNKVEAFPKLAKAVTLPERKLVENTESESGTGGRAPGRSGRRRARRAS